MATPQTQSQPAGFDALGRANGILLVLHEPGAGWSDPLCLDEPVSAVAANDDSIRLPFTIESFDPGPGAKAEQSRDTIANYNNRLRVLSELAARDGYFINNESLEGFAEFFNCNPFIRRGRLVLMENGNLRAVWKNEKQAHVGLQFLNKRTVQYVIFARREPSVATSRVTGTDTIKGVRKQIEAFELADLIYM